jgi:hypothetical protein
MSFYTTESLTEKIINSTNEYEMIFIGENPHYNDKINDLVVELSIEFAKRTDFKIYAKESLYCLYPFLETDSKSGKESKIIPKRITEYNKKADSERQITVTAVDLAHSVKHSRHIVNNFIQKHILDLRNKSLKNEISNLSMKIKTSSNLGNVENAIQELIQILRENEDEFHQTIFEELSFYFELLKISLPLNDLSDKSQSNMRNEWFKKTILRAIRRNQSYGKIIFHVGSPHAYKFYLNEDDYYVGKIPEAGYFKDKAYTIQIRPFYFGQFGEPIDEITDPIEKKALAMTGNEKSVFVDLHEYNDQEDNIGIEKYYLNGEYQFDGIIYVKDEDDA